MRSLPLFAALMLTATVAQAQVGVLDPSRLTLSVGADYVWYGSSTGGTGGTGGVSPLAHDQELRERAHAAWSLGRVSSAVASFDYGNRNRLTALRGGLQIVAYKPPTGSTLPIRPSVALGVGYVAYNARTASALGLAGSGEWEGAAIVAVPVYKLLVADGEIRYGGSSSLLSYALGVRLPIFQGKESL